MAVANAGWMTAGRICADALSLVLFGIIAREYGPAGLGIYSTYFAVATILYDIVALGIEDFGVREYTSASDSNRPPILQRLVRLQLMVAAVAIAGLGVFCIATAMNLEQLLTLAFLATFQLSNALARTLLIPSLAGGSVARITLTSVLGRLGVAMVAIIAAESANAPLILALSGFPVFGLAGLFYMAWIQRHKFPRRGWLRWHGDEWKTLKVLFPFAAADALNSVIVRIPMVVLFLFAGEAAAGLFATAFKLTEMGWAVLTYFVLASYAALMRAANVNHQHMAAQSDFVLRQILVVGGLLAWGLFSVAPAVVVPLLGEKLAAARPLVEAMAPFLLLQATATYLLRLMLVFGRQTLRLKILALQTLVTAALCVLLANRFGALGTIFALTSGC